MIPGSANPLLLAGAEAGYAIERSVRFNSSDSAYLSRTPASAGNRKTWTWAGWVKLAKTSFNNLLECVGPTTPGTRTSFMINDLDKIDFFTDNTSSSRITTTQVFRDYSAWYHIVLAVDTTQATASNRVKIYVNGSQITTFSTATYPSQNLDTQVNNTQLHTIGRVYDPFYANMYLADIHFIDGQALDPTSFGEFDDNGIWQPIAYSGSYGTNGFHLPFDDNSTAAALGTDTSGNSNTWTVNNISVAAGAGNDSLVDVPTNGTETDTGVGGEVRGNYATLNTLQAGANSLLTNGNLDIQETTAGPSQTLGTLGVSSGKWYFEATVNVYTGSEPDPLVGISNASNPLVTNYPGLASNSYAVYCLKTNSFIQKVNNGSFTNTNASQVVLNDTISVAFDLDVGKFWVAKNGTWIDSGNPASGVNPLFSGLSGSYLPTVRGSGSTSTAGLSLNFGQRPFAYTAPSGFKALCTANLPAPVITKPSEYMDVVTYTGNGGTQSISGLEFSPDLVWIKQRSSGIDDHILKTTLQTKFLSSNQAFAERGNDNDLITSLDAAGFSVNSTYLGGANNSTNGSGITFVAWTWDAGDSTVSNTDGSITSQVRANPSAGFSIVTYTGTGAAATVGHGLGVIPLAYIIKRRDSADNWYYFTSVIDGSLDYLFLDTTTAKANSVSAVPASLIFNVSTSPSLNTSGGTYVAYCFAPVTGYSNGFSYTGNGSTDGSFVYLGFRPRLILLKCSSTTGNWTLLDTAREGYNVDNDPLYPNLTNAEGTTDLLDITSNGFKLRTTDASVNSNAATYIGFAWAESPFNYSRAR